MRKRIPKILVTGGAGFIGSAFVRLLNRDYPRRGLSLIVVDKLTYAGDLKRLGKQGLSPKGTVPAFKFYKTDICNKKQIEAIFSKEKPDIVVHFAAESITEDSYIPIQSVPRVGTRMLTFSEMWEEQSKNNKIHLSKNGEVIFLRGVQTKALSFLNGGQWMPIKAISRHWYDGKVIKLIQKWGIVKATPNHSIYSSNLTLSTPLKNPELLVIRKINEDNKKFKNVRKDLLEFIAAYITEGNTTFNKANGSYTVEINQDNREWVENIGMIGKRIFGVNYNIVRGMGSFHLQFSNKKLFNYLRKNCGYYSENKFFPNWIFDLQPKFREYFWKKLLEGDGTEDGRYTTTSYKLANQLSLLLSLIGNDFRVFERIPKKRNYKVSWEFKTQMDGQHFGLNLKKKMELDYAGWVYDLEITKTNNFVCGIGNIVCHNTHVDRSINDVSPFIDTNIKGTQVLLDAACEYKVKKFIFISTDEVFGEIANGKFSESSPIKPNSPYAASKAAADLLVQAYIRTYKFPALIIRPCNNYGPWQYPEKLIPVAIASVLKGKKAPIYAKGQNIREWLYVDDCARGIMRIIQKGKIGEVYNLGSGIESKNINTVKLLLKNLGVSQNNFKFVQDRPGHDIRYSLNSGKIKKTLGWRPKINFKKGIKLTVIWYLQNKDWLLRNCPEK